MPGEREFITPGDSGWEEARWNGALDELLALRLVETLGDKGGTFRVTRSGYEVADVLGAKGDHASS